MKWNEAMLNRRDFLDSELRKLMDKKEPSAVDLEKQNELLDQWAMLQWQKQAVLQPKPDSGVPGATTNWLVFLSVTCLLSHTPNHSHTTGTHLLVWSYVSQFCS